MELRTARGGARWETSDELEFLTWLGAWSKAGVGGHLGTREALLQKYLSAAGGREDWGSMKQDVVLARARALRRGVQRARRPPG